MMLLRGKREQRKPSKEGQNRHRRGRPTKSPAEIALYSRANILRKLQSHHAAVQQKMDAEQDRLSILEKLPVELVQHIFFYSLEINLPRASEHLREMLSTEQIFNALIVFAYFDDDGVSPVETRHFLPAEYRPLSCAEKVRLQRSIFNCRWGTHDRIISCMQTLSRLTMVQAWHREHALEESHKQGSTVTHAKIPMVVTNGAIRDLAPLPGLDEETKLEQHFFARRKLEDLGNNRSTAQHSPSPFLPRIITWTSSMDEQGTIHKSTGQSVTILACRHVPDRLLSGSPWTTRDLDLLRLLRQGYTAIQGDHVMSISAKAMFNGMRNAIEQEHTVALKILLDMHNIFFKSGSWTIHNMMATQLTPASHHPIPVDLFHSAVRQKSQATELLSLLLRAGIDSLPQDDETVTAWAIHSAQDGSILAQWLLKHMEGTADYGLPRRRHLFVDGCLSWRARGNLPFPDASFAAELGYIPGTPIVPAGLDGKVCGDDNAEEEGC